MDSHPVKSASLRTCFIFYMFSEWTNNVIQSERHDNELFVTVLHSLLPHVHEYNIQQALTAVRGMRSVLSSRLTAGYLHTCAVKEQGAGGGSEVKCMELKLHFTAVQPSLSLILLQRGFILQFVLNWGGRKLWPDGRKLNSCCRVWDLLSDITSAFLPTCWGWNSLRFLRGNPVIFTAHTDDESQFLSLWPIPGGDETQRLVSELSRSLFWWIV